MAATQPVVTIDRQSLLQKFAGKFLYQKQHSASANTINTSDVERLISAASNTGRHGLRDATIIMMAYSHGLKVSEIINLKWSHIDLEEGTILVSRLKNGQKTIHPLSSNEIDKLRKLENINPDMEYVFVTDRNSPLTSTHVLHLVKRASKDAGLGLNIAPDMLSCACKYNFIYNRQKLPATQH